MTAGPGGEDFLLRIDDVLTVSSINLRLHDVDTSLVSSGPAAGVTR